MKHRAHTLKLVWKVWHVLESPLEAKMKPANARGGPKLGSTGAAPSWGAEGDRRIALQFQVGPVDGVRLAAVFVPLAKGVLLFPLKWLGGLCSPAVLAFGSGCSFSVVCLFGRELCGKMFVVCLRADSIPAKGCTWDSLPLVGEFSIQGEQLMKRSAPLLGYLENQPRVSHGSERGSVTRQLGGSWLLRVRAYAPKPSTPAVGQKAARAGSVRHSRRVDCKSGRLGGYHENGGHPFSNRSKSDSLFKRLY